VRERWRCFYESGEEDLAVSAVCPLLCVGGKNCDAYHEFFILFFKLFSTFQPNFPDLYIVTRDKKSEKKKLKK